MTGDDADSSHDSDNMTNLVIYIRIAFTTTHIHRMYPF